MKRRILSLVLAFAMLLSLGFSAIALSPADFTDLPDKSHFTYDGIVSAIENGIMQGTGNGIFTPATVITRAEAAIYLVNVMGATSRASLSQVTDAKSDAWYYGRLAIAVQMSIIEPFGGKLRPDDLVTREEAFDMMAKAIKINGGRTSNLSKFTDANTLSIQYVDTVGALVSNGYIKGIPAANNTLILSPKGTMTRGEFATLFGNVFQEFVTTSGTISKVADGNVVVKASGATLKNLTVKGDLIIAESVGNGEVTLDNVKVQGRLIVRGGGKNSILIVGGSQVSEIVVARTDGAVSVKVDSNSAVQVIYVDDGKDDVIIQGNVARVVVETGDVPVTLQNGTVGTVTISANDAAVTLAADSKVTNLNVNAKDAAIETKSGSQITTLTVSSSASGSAVTGSGMIAKAEVNASNVDIKPTPTTTVVASGVTGTTVAGSSVSGGSTTNSNIDNSGGRSNNSNNGNNNNNSSNSNNDYNDNNTQNTLTVVSIATIGSIAAEGNKIIIGTVNTTVYTYPTTADVILSDGTTRTVSVIWYQGIGNQTDNCSSGGGIVEKANAWTTSGVLQLPNGVTNPNNIKALIDNYFYGIRVVVQPTKVVYTVNDNLDLAGIMLTYLHEDGVTKEENIGITDFVTKGITSNPVNNTQLSSAGSVTVTLTQSGTNSTATLDITVNAVADPE